MDFKEIIIEDLKFEPDVHGSETSGEINEIVEKGDWITLGYIRPIKKMSLDDFSFKLRCNVDKFLNQIFKIVKEEFEKRGYKVERTSALWWTSSPKYRIWFTIKKNGKIAYCTLTYSEELEYNEFSDTYLSEVYMVCNVK